MPGRPALQDMLTRLFTSRSASSPRCGAVAAAAVGGGSGCPPPWTERARPPPRRAPRAAHPAAWLHPDCHAEAVGTELRLRQTSSGATTGKAKSVSSSGTVGGGRSPRGDLLAVATARGTHENAVARARVPSQPRGAWGRGDGVVKHSRVRPAQRDTFQAFPQARRPREHTRPSEPPLPLRRGRVLGPHGRVRSAWLVPPATRRVLAHGQTVPSWGLRPPFCCWL